MAAVTQATVTQPAPDDQQLVNQLRDRLRPHLGQERLDEYAHVFLNHLAPLLDHSSRASIHRRALAALSDLGVLSLYLADPMVTEVAVNHGNEVWVDRSGRMERVDSIDGDELAVLIERITAPLGLRFDLTSPIVDARLPDGHRV